MKKIFTLFLVVCSNAVFAQSEKEPDHKSVPQSSAFKLVDISPYADRNAGYAESFRAGRFAELRKRRELAAELLRGIYALLVGAAEEPRCV